MLYSNRLSFVSETKRGILVNSILESRSFPKDNYLETNNCFIKLELD